MIYPIKHGCLYNGIVYHISKYDLISNTRFKIKIIFIHEITTQTTGTSDSVSMIIDFISCSCNIRAVRHLKCIRHMSCEGYIGHNCFDSMIFNNINDVRNKITCLPGYCTSWFEDNIDIIFFLKFFRILIKWSVSYPLRVIRCPPPMLTHLT